MLAVVVEDEWLIRIQIADTLRDAGWEVEEFGSGSAALEFLNQRRPISLLVSDIRLGGRMTGWDVAEAYREILPEVRVIYCSGNPVDEARQVSGSKFLPKPCSMEALLKAAGG